MKSWILNTSGIILSLNIAQAQITHYPVNDTIYTNGSLEFDMDLDGSVDFTFDIVPLQIGGFATRVLTSSSSSILDSSTYGYPDTLNFGDTINGYWNDDSGALGTFNNAGQFKGAGDKYLGVKFGGNTGWIELNASIGNDTLIIIAAGYTDTENGIFAGQTEPLYTFQIRVASSIDVYPNPASDRIQIQVPNIPTGMIMRIYSAQGITFYNDYFEPVIDVSQFNNGVYFIVLDDGKIQNRGKFIVAR